MCCRSYSTRYRTIQSTLWKHVEGIVSGRTTQFNAQSWVDTCSRPIFDTMSARSFTYSYRKRQLAPIMAFLPNHKRTIRLRRSMSSTASSSTAGVNYVQGTSRARTIWYLRILAAGMTALLALRLINRDVKTTAGPGGDSYTEWYLCGIQKISLHTSIFTLRSTSGVSFDDTAPLLSISIKEPNSNIQRPYTVLDMDGDLIKVLIKQYDGGEISRYIHSRKLNSKLFLKQAPSTYQLPIEIPKHFVLISGGTGIATTFQFLKYFSRLPLSERPYFQVLYASTDWAEVYLREEFAELKKDYGDKLNIDYFVDSCGAFIDSEDIKKTYSGKSAFTLVCGSDGFVEHIAGRKPEFGQGEIGGLLAANGIQENVWKL